MKTKFEEIVDVRSIGSTENPIVMNELLVKANTEQFTPSVEDKDRVLLLIIDMQKDFMENGALGVPNSHGDVERLTKWIYDNMERITTVTVSIDTHNPFQIFHPSWWVGADGKNPDPFTAITKQDLDLGRWKPVLNPIKSREYVEHLEKDGKKVLVIWTYHCLQGTSGHSLENQVANMVYFHSVAKRSIAIRMVKGQDPMSEMYGILKAEYDPKNRINIDFLNKLEEYDKIVIAGEAKSHCVLESVKQILEHYKNKPEVTEKIYILEDAMSNIQGFEDATEKEFEGFKSDYKVNIVKTTEFTLEDA